ncbi:MAG: hypothetical protein GY796_21695 [Chloroflexi bacterium]|nr:hypothetical protein [Chloroflexota bacterium]
MRHVWTATRLFLIPAVQVVCYLQFGFSGFCVSVLTFWVFNKLFRIAQGYRPYQAIGEWIWLLIPAFFGAALFSVDPFFVKYLPTVLGCSLILLGSLLLWPDRPSWATISSGFESFSSRTQIAILASVAVLVASNEIIRANAPTEVWVWFYAFLLLETTCGALLILFLIGCLRALLTAVADAFGRY